MSLIYPGDVSAVEPLVDILRNLHNDERTRILADIARRKESGAPLDDHTRWEQIEAQLRTSTEAAAQRDTAKVRAASAESLAILSAPVEDPGEFAPPPQASNVEVSLRIITARDLRRLAAADSRAIDRQRSAFAALRKADADNDADAREAASLAVEKASDMIIDARKALIEATLVEIRIGGDVPRGDIPLMNIIERNLLINPLYDACAWFQDLPWGKGERSGSRARAT